METKRGTYSFIILLSIYLMLHAAQVRGIGPEWIRFYGKDLIIVPLILLGTTRVLAVFNRKKEIGKKEIITLVIYISVVFEVIIPMIKPQVNPDILDVVMYVIGAEAYYLMTRYMPKNDRLKNILS